MFNLRPKGGVRIRLTQNKSDPVSSKSMRTETTVHSRAEGNRMGPHMPSRSWRERVRGKTTGAWSDADSQAAGGSLDCHPRRLLPSAEQRARAPHTNLEETGVVSWGEGMYGKRDIKNQKMKEGELMGRGKK